MEMGILGHVSAYFGIVEAQGRGSLHIHMLLWLEHTPTTKEMQQLLKTEEFQEKLHLFLDHNIHTHLPGMSTAKELSAIARDAESTYVQPPNLDSNNFWDVMSTDECVLV